MNAQNRLFHFHYRVPDASHAAAVLANLGLPPHRRYGRVDGQSRSLPADEPPPDGFRLRLQDAQVGTANVTIAPGPRLEFDHFGVVSPDFDGVLSRARDRGWHVNAGEHRTFLHTPWGFRIEVHPTDGVVASSLGPVADGRFTSVVVAVPEPEAVRAGLDAILGDVPPLEFERSRADRPAVPRLTLAGEPFPDGRTIRASALVPTDSC